MSVPLLATARGLVWTPLLVPTYLGLVIAAIGDLQKSWIKAKEGESHLVTSWLYRFLRHPNYQGEQLLWLSSAVLGLLALTPVAKPWAAVGSCLAIALGQLGIQFVLSQATTPLNKRYEINYADDPKFQSWNAFKGIELPAPRPPPVTPVAVETSSWNTTNLHNLTEADLDCDADDEYVL